MEQRRKDTGTQSISGLSMVMALITFLAMWSGLTLLLSDPGGIALPPPMSTPRGMLVSLLLFWLPVGTGTIAWLTGLVGVSSAKERQPDVQRRSLIGIILGLAPICLATAWLGWVLASSLR